MKKMRKAISLIVALCFLLSIAAPAMAADASDVEKAGNRLLALGIIEGYTDGTLGLDKQITRAEIAVVLAKASGMASAAEMLKNTPSKFTDVKTGEWYTGWINLAASQGWVKGDPQGTFRPNDPISYREIVTVLMKILGYNDNLPGEWPANYLAKAASLGITKGISFDAKAPAVRGDVFLMTSRVLDKEVVVWDNNKNDFVYKEGRPTLLEDKHDVVKIEDVVVTEISLVKDDLKDNQLRVAGDSTKYTLLNGNPMDYFGKKISMWVNDDDEIFAVQVENESDVIHDTISVKDSDVAKNEVNLIQKNDDYKVDEKAVIYLNNDRKDDLKDLFEELKGNNPYGRIVLNDDGKIAFMYLYDFNVVNAGVVTNADSNKLEVKVGTSSKKVTYSNYDEVYVFDSTFNKGEVADIEKDKVVYAWENDEDDELFVVVAGKVVEGKLERTVTNGIFVDGKKYSTVKDVTTASSNNDEDVAMFVYDSDVVKDLVGTNVVVILDINGKLRHVRGDVEATSGKLYGIMIDADKTSVTIVNAEGKEVTYNVEDRVDARPFAEYFDKFENNKYVNKYNYIPVEYQLNKDGEIKKGTLKVVAADAIGVSGVTTVGKGYDNTNGDVVFHKNDYIKVDGDTYFIGSKTIIMKFEAGEDSDPKVVSWDDIKDTTIPQAGDVEVKFVIVGEEGEEAKFVAIYKGYNAIAADDYYYAIVTDNPAYNGEKYEVKIDVVSNDKVESGWIVLSKDEYKSVLTKGTLFSFTLNTDGEIHKIDLETKVLTVDKISGRTITAEEDGKNYTYTFDRDAVVYSLKSDGSLDKKRSYDNVAVGDKLTVLVDKENERIIKVATIGASKPAPTPPGPSVKIETYLVTKYVPVFGRFDVEDKYGNTLSLFVEDFKGYKIGDTTVSKEVMVAWLNDKDASGKTNGEKLATITVENDVLVVPSTDTVPAELISVKDNGDGSATVVMFAPKNATEIQVYSHVEDTTYTLPVGVLSFVKEDYKYTVTFNPGFAVNDVVDIIVDDVTLYKDVKIVVTAQ